MSMRVKQGWSGEVQPNVWAKVSVELDEQDLRRLLNEGEVRVDVADVPLMTAYSLLEVEAERLVLMKLMVRHGYPDDQGRSELAGFEQAKHAIIDQLRQLAPPPAWATS